MLSYDETLKIADRFFKSVEIYFACKDVIEVNRANISNVNSDADFIGYTYPIPDKECEKYIDALLENPCVSFERKKTSGKSVNENPCRFFFDGTYKDDKNYNCYVFRYKFIEDEQNFDTKDLKPIMEKIEKLLKITEENGATEGEVVMASLKAQRLMAKYHIDNLDAEKKDEPIMRAIYNTPQGSLWKGLLGDVVARNYRCELLITSDYKSICFMGYRDDCTIARRIFKFLFDFACESSKKYCADNDIKGNTTSIRNTFCSAFVKGVASELDAQCTALALTVPQRVSTELTNIIDYNRKNKISFSNHNMSVSNDYGARKAGYNEGRNAVRGQRLHTAKNAIEG